MKKMLATLLIIWFVAACGGGGGETCDFDIHTFTNGANLDSATTYWDCQADGNWYQFTFTNDGAGLEVDAAYAGAFTWEETGCREIVVHMSLGDVSVTELQGSIASGVLTFTMSADNTMQSSCVLRNL